MEKEQEQKAATDRPLGRKSSEKAWTPSTSAAISPRVLPYIICFSSELLTCNADAVGNWDTHTLAMRTCVCAWLSSKVEQDTE